MGLLYIFYPFLKNNFNILPKTQKDTQNPTDLLPLTGTRMILVGFTLSQATKALRESRCIALLYFRPPY